MLLLLVLVCLLVFVVTEKWIFFILAVLIDYQIFEAFFHQGFYGWFQLSFSSNIWVLFYYFNYFGLFFATVLLLNHIWLNFCYFRLFVWTLQCFTAAFLSENYQFLLQAIMNKWFFLFRIIYKMFAFNRCIQLVERTLRSLVTDVTIQIILNIDALK